MIIPELNKKLGVLIGQLHNSLSLAEQGELEDPLKKSTEIFTALLGMSSFFPTQQVSNDNLRQSAISIFEKNIGITVSILQFCANGSSELDLQTVCGKLVEFLPEQKFAVNPLACLGKPELKNDCKFTQNVACYLRNLIGAINYILETLPLFKLAFLACSGAVFCSQEFARASSELTEFLTMLEAKFVSPHTLTKESCFSATFINSLDRPFKIATSALWFLFTIPAIECLEFDVILWLCKNAIQIFVCAVDLFKSFTQFLLKDFISLEGVQNELFKKIHLVSEYCEQIIKFERSDVEFGDFKNVDNSESTVCSNADVSEENPASKFTVKMTDTSFNVAGPPNKSQKSTAVNLENHVKKTHFTSGDASEKLQRTSAIKSENLGEDVYCDIVPFPKKLQETLAWKQASVNFTPYAKTSPTRKEIFSKLFGQGRHISATFSPSRKRLAGGEIFSKLFNQESAICVNFSPRSKTSKARGEIFYKLFSQERDTGTKYSPNIKTSLARKDFFSKHFGQENDFYVKFSPYTQTNPAKGKIFSKLFSQGRGTRTRFIPDSKTSSAGRESFSKRFSREKGICMKLSPNYKISPTKGEIFSKLFGQKRT